jgi:carboxymethylenebutenolidase
MPARPEALEITTADGVSRASLHGGGGGRRPAILMYVDAFGVRPAMEEMAARLAGLGYVVVLPDVFYRAGEFAPFDVRTAFSDPPERARLMALIGSLTHERLAADARAWLDALTARPDVAPDRLGVTGYCMGGRLAFLTAALLPDRLRAAAAFHAGGLVSEAPDSPHRLADRVTASVYVGAADGDRSCTPAHQGALAAALGAAGVDYRLELYRGKRHGFAVTDNVGPYDPDAAARHWRRTESFFGETLGARGA